ncbi:hypothetical protein QTO34_002636 [Cnephaeus nilssonii]|uniref:RII binding domain-containing protein n=1 Tax=Cnephaeus nilssonii TaxID=3371016 RepID=A0AA40LLK3_CNENI|nr:hypothetical protein QTO34_002636 [Eptesicus nilssonii]
MVPEAYFQEASGTVGIMTAAPVRWYLAHSPEIGPVGLLREKKPEPIINPLRTQRNNLYHFTTSLSREDEEGTFGEHGSQSTYSNTKENGINGELTSADRETAEEVSARIVQVVTAEAVAVLKGEQEKEAQHKDQPAALPLAAEETANLPPSPPPSPASERTVAVEEEEETLEGPVAEEEKPDTLPGKECGAAQVSGQPKGLSEGQVASSLETHIVPEESAPAGAPQEKSIKEVTEVSPEVKTPSSAREASKMEFRDQQELTASLPEPLDKKEKGVRESK